MASSSHFRFTSKYCFLTYPHCPITPQEFMPFLRCKFDNYAVFFIAIISELHEDGSPHIHALVQCDKRPFVRNPANFDFGCYHPNIQPARDSKAVLDYISKSGTPLIWGEFKRNRVSPSKRDERWRNIINTSTSKEEYLSAIKDAFPQEWATRLQWLEYSADKLFPPVQEPYVSPYPDISCPEELSAWMDENLYLVSIEGYQLVHPELYKDDVISNLDYMDDYTRNHQGEPDLAPYMSADQRERVRRPGHGRWDSIITSTGGLTLPHTMNMPSTTSLTISPSNSALIGSNSSEARRTTPSTPSTAGKGKSKVESPP